jgi:ComF family protein
MQAFEVLLDFVFPRSCQECGAACDATRFYCWDCLSEFHVIQPPFCSLCGDPVPGTIDHDYLCIYCSRQRPHFDGARSAVRYDGAPGTAIRAIKYESSTWLVPDMAMLLDACFRTHYDHLSFDAICCVPLYPVKLRTRGYNQALLLARSLAKHRRLPVWGQVLRRVRDIGSQTHLTAAERVSNVAQAFDVARPRKVNGKRLLLVDDVMTTGATVNECARVLKKAGAESVHVITVARG